MKKLVYIALCDLWDNVQIGIRNKVFAQLKSLEKHYETYLVTWKSMLLYTFRYRTPVGRGALLSYEEIYAYIEEFIQKERVDVVYLRYLQTNPWLNRFLKEMKRLKVTVVVEFPTFPYDAEIDGKVELEEDRLYRNELRRYVNYSVNYNELDSVMGIPSLSLQNGVDIEEVPVKKDSSGGEITLLAVAAMNIWHGYDRMIRGLASYYRSSGQKRKVVLRLVGNGKESPRYQELAEALGVQEYVKSVGIKYGRELTDEFDRADIAVGTLGMHRIGLLRVSTIKTKEYCARGIPFVCAYEDTAFPDNIPFVYRLPGDESDIDVFELLDFYDRSCAECSRETIREYAEKNLTWDNIFAKLYEWID